MAVMAQKLAPILVLVAACLLAAPAAAQRSRGGGGRWQHSDRPLTPEKIQQRIARTEGFLRKMDANGNGMIDPEEVTGPAKYFAERVLSRAGVEPKFPMAISQIQQALVKGYQARAASPSGTASTGSGMKPSAGAPRGPLPAVNAPGKGGFGETAKPPVVAGFGPQASPGVKVGPVAPAPSASAYGNRPSASQADPAVRNLAATIIQKHDKNANGKLDREEWPEHRRWGTFDEANRMGGNFVVLEELATHLADYQRRGQLSMDLSDSSGEAKPASGDDTATTPTKIVPKSGRFLTPAERLPQGLPPWFATKDVDGDGQVTMAEYSGEWTAERAAEFAGFDLNGDGVVTPQECLKAVKKAEQAQASESSK